MSSWLKGYIAGLIVSALFHGLLGAVKAYNTHERLSADMKSAHVVQLSCPDGLDKSLVLKGIREGKEAPSCCVVVREETFPYP